MANNTWNSAFDTSSTDKTTAERTIVVYQYYFERQIIAVLFILASIVGSFGNSLVIIAVTLSKKLRTTTNVFVVNLAIADLLSCTALPWQASSVLDKDGWPLQDAYWICVSTAFVLVLCGACSINNLAFIALTRWVGITKPRHTSYRMRSPLKLTVMVALTWLIPLGCVILPLVSDFGELGYEKTYNLCSWDTTNRYSMYFNFLIIGLCYPLQFGIIAFCYSSIFVYVRGKYCEMASASWSRAPSISARVSGANLRSKLRKRQLSVTKNLVCIVLAFAISQTPYFVVLLLYTDTSYRLVPYFTVILFSNCCVNPIIYAVSHPDFKETFRYMMRCRLKEMPQSQTLNCHRERQTTPGQNERECKL